MNVLDLAQKHVALKKVSTTNGGEWQGPCPSCGGSDRFHVWPEENTGAGSYWCRGCDRKGDAIQFLRDFEGLSYGDACRRLGVAPSSRPETDMSAPRPPSSKKPEFQPAAPTTPAELWQDKAAAFCDWAQENIECNDEVMAWLAARGIDSNTASLYGLGWNPGENDKDFYRARKAWGLPEVLREDGRPKSLWIPRGLVIPDCAGGLVRRIRIRRTEGEPRYYVVPGSAMGVMVCGAHHRAFVVVESELDAMACAAATSLAGAVAMGSVSAKPDAAAYDILKGALAILNALDYDRAGAQAMAWWAENFPRCTRWPVPQGKDPGEAYALGTDLKDWIEAGLPPALTIKSEVQGARIKEQGGNLFDEERVAIMEEGRPAAVQPPAAAPVIPVKAGIQEKTDALPDSVSELYQLLKANPRVMIVNAENRLAVLRDGKYVGGRIAALVFRDPACVDYILNHPAPEIRAGNFMNNCKVKRCE